MAHLSESWPWGEMIEYKENLRNRNSDLKITSTLLSDQRTWQGVQRSHFTLSECKLSEEPVREQLKIALTDCNKSI